MSKQVKVGTARYGGKKRKYFKLKDGESVFRILPPLGSLADDGRWSVFYRVHYGYKNSKQQGRAFQSPFVQNRKTKMVEVPDAALERIQLLQAKLDEAKKAGDKATVAKLLELVGGPKSRFNLDSNHYMNVMDEQGNVGVLKIRHRCKLALDTTIKALRDKGIDPLSVDNGRFFVFTRSGNAFETTYQVAVKQNKLQIDGVGEVFQDVVHKLTPDILNRLGDEAADLDKLFRRLTAEEVARIVKEGPAAVDEIFDTKAEETAEETTEEDQVYDDEYDVTEPAASMQAAAAAPAPTVTAPVAATVVVTAPAPTPAPAAVVQVSAPASEPKKTTAQTISDMSVEDFLASLDK